MKEIYDYLRVFFELRKSLDPSDRFNFILFKESGPNFLEDFTLDPEKVLNALKDLEPEIVRANVAGGIFTALTLITEGFKEIPDKCFRLIILTDSGSIKIPTLYLLQLQELIDKVFTFPFFIDVVRFNIDDTEEDKKLMSLAKKCNGYIHEINSLDSLPDILEVLAIKREIPLNAKLLIENNKKPQFNLSFYEDVAESVIHVEEKVLCSICNEKNNEKMIQCPSCLSVIHEICGAQWAKESHIGIIHIVRCYQCYYLLKLDRDYVLNVQSGKITKKKKKVGFQAFLEKHKLVLTPQVRNVQDPMGIIVLKSADIMHFPKQVRKRAAVSSRNKDLRIIFCINCGRILMSSYKECLTCFFPL
ncbi:hypothetical protein LCGC14_0635050 [marine sediment metagenome]|uniref:VWFA domain-containing protein n=1 Tax=marine sediment metagenome TaxID=412755 RepID=A0A0F9R637_9ZZZZ